MNAVVIDDLQLYQAHRSEKINYSAERILNDELFIQSTGLLQQNDIRRQQIDCFEWNGTKAFFKTEDDVGFDLFSAVFYCISRYEEYLEYEPDAYGRYAHWNSVAWKNTFLNQPVVDVWLQYFNQHLQKKFTNYKPPITSCKLIPTYDIDIAWSYKYKGFWRSFGAFLNKPSTLIKRLNVISGSEPDPFDSYEWLEQLQKTYQLNPVYFFLVAEERGELDKNISPKQKAFQRLIMQTKQHAFIGLHPSVHSNTAKECLGKEKNTLQQIIHAPVTKSRHHYLKFYVPHSYRELVAAGITDDYSMGYGTVNGFRASTCNSFLWFDLEKEQTTSLRIHPFAYMEANSFYELRHSPAEALAELKQLFEEVKKVNGTIITIFHNQFLGTDTMFPGWKEMYEEFLRFVVPGYEESDEH